MFKGNEMPQVGNGQGQKTKSLLEKKQQFVAQGISNLAPIFIETAKGAVVNILDHGPLGGLDLYRDRQGGRGQGY